MTLWMKFKKAALEGWLRYTNSWSHWLSDNVVNSSNFVLSSKLNNSVGPSCSDSASSTKLPIPMWKGTFLYQSHTLHEVGTGVYLGQWLDTIHLVHNIKRTLNSCVLLKTHVLDARIYLWSIQGIYVYVSGFALFTIPRNLDRLPIKNYKFLIMDGLELFNLLHITLIWKRIWD